MLPAERIQRIAELLEKNGSVTIEALAREFNISEMTARRDLERLESMGIAGRCYGGAISSNELRSEEGIYDRKKHNMDAKTRLAARCVSLVKPGNVVYLDAGTTTLCIAKAISKTPNLTVVTNDLFIAGALLNTGARIHLLGGMIQNSSGSAIGEGVTRAVEGMRFNIAFIGTAAISDQMESMTPTVEKTFLRHAVCRNTNEVYLVADSSKFHISSTYLVNGLEDYTGVITDAVFSAEDIQLIQKKNINIIEAK